ncbi:hypothetical protein, partial [Thiolapillus sp.]|uniref:hypothetical protein n=1 Tax=Thiolapillus sp. TaxID=2017437 RepID=UPI003AF9A6AD
LSPSHSFHHHHHHQSLNREGRWGTTDDFATSFLNFSLFSTALWDLPNSRPVHSLMLSSHLFLCPPCLLPPFTALEDHEGTVSIGGRTITNLRFADDIDGLAGEEDELANLVERLDKASTAYGMEISAEKTKLMSNNTSGINTEIKVNGQKLEAVTSFKYLGSVITDEGSKPELLCRIAQA